MELIHTAPNYLWNVLSILLGLAAIVFALHSVSVKGCLTCCTLGFSCCGAALLFQFIELERLARIRDWSAIADTLHARSLAAGALFAAVLILNLFALYRSGKKC